MSWLLETHRVELEDTIRSDVKAGLSCSMLVCHWTPQSLSYGCCRTGQWAGFPEHGGRKTWGGHCLLMDERTDLEAHVFRN